MATVDTIRTGLIEKILSIDDKDFLEALDELISSNKSESAIVELSNEQKIMLEMSEILKYINVAKQTINDLDVKSKPDYKFGIQVNNHIIIHVGADNQFSIQSKLNSKILKISDYFGEDYYVSEITYLTGDDGDFYQITIKSGLRDTQIHLYDTKLNLIY